MTQLVTLSEIDFENIEPDEFADAVQKERRNDTGIDQHPVVQEAIAYYQSEFFERQGQMQPSSITRLNNAWKVFVNWCIATGRYSLPATAKTVEDYLKTHSQTLHRNTLKIHLWAIGKMHVISGLPNPCKHRYVKGQMSQIVNQKVRGRERIRQAPPFRESDLIALTQLWAPSHSPNKLRDLMILSICYETMLRKGNIENILIGDIEFLHDGTASILIPFTKTNHSGEDEVRLLSQPVTELVKRYLDLPDVNNDASCYLLQRFKYSGKKIDKDTSKEAAFGAELPVSAKFIVRVFARAQKALDKMEQAKFSGHSARVGATQDLLDEGYTTLQVMQAGGWSSEKMVIQYGRHSAATKGGMALKRSKSS